MEAVERIKINNCCKEARYLVDELKVHLSIVFESCSKNSFKLNTFIRVNGSEFKSKAVDFDWKSKVEGLEDAEEIEIVIYYIGMERLSSAGIPRQIMDYLRENDSEALRKNVVYKTIKLSDWGVDFICVYPNEEKWHTFQEGNTDDIKGLRWYTPDFSIEIDGSEEVFDDKSIADQFTEVGNGIIKKFGCFDAPGEPEYGEYIIFSSLQILSEEVEELTGCIEKLYNLSKSYECSFNLETSFFTQPDDELKDYVFAVMNLIQKDGKVEWEYCIL